jgi:hypothetical protein
MVNMVNNYSDTKTKLVSCCRMIMTAVIISSFVLGLSIVGAAVSVAAGSISSPQIGGQELQEEEQLQQQMPQGCGNSSSGGTDGTNASTTTGIVGANVTTSSLYENPNYGIQILCPENWVYGEEEDPFTGDLHVTFMSLTEARQFGRALQAGVTPEVAPIVGVVITEANLDLQLFADSNIRNLTSSGYEVISTNLNATLSGMPAFEVVYADANRTMFLQDWTIQGDRAYAVIYTNQESRFNEFLPIVQDMISSFTITNDTATWLPYQNVTYGVSMLYPSSWTQQNSTAVVAEDDRFILVSEFFSPEQAEGYFAHVTIAIDGMPQSTNIEGYRTQSIDSYRQDPDFEDFQLLSSSVGNFTLAGMPAYTLEITYTDPEFGPQNMLEVGAIFDNRVYYIQYFADLPIYQKYLPIVERMIESFQIMQQ